MPRKRQSDDTQVIAFRAPREMARLISKLAREDYRSRSNFLVGILSRVLPKVEIIRENKRENDEGKQAH